MIDETLTSKLKLLYYLHNIKKEKKIVHFSIITHFHNIFILFVKPLDIIIKCMNRLILIF